MHDTRLSKIGLSLSGGGFAGGGALTGFACALDLYMKSHGVNDFGFYSGISAGAVVGSFLAAGISPLEMAQATVGQKPSQFKPFRRRDLYQLNFREVPSAVWRVARSLWGTVTRSPESAPDQPRERSGLGLGPSALLSNQGLADVVRKNLEAFKSNRFSDLDTRFRVVFFDPMKNRRVIAGNGPGEISDIPISEAVAASTAIPGVFTPRRIDCSAGTMFGIDGGLGGASLDVRGLDELELLIAYNHSGYVPRDSMEHASAMSLVSLSLQMATSQRNLAELARYIDRNPERHVWVFQPPPTGLGGLLSYNALVSKVGETFDLAKTWLLEHDAYYRLVLERLGVTLNPDFSRLEFDDILDQGMALKG